MVKPHIILIILLVCLVMTFVVFIVNSKLSKCNDGSIYNEETKLCSYNSFLGINNESLIVQSAVDCGEGETFSDGRCFYEKKQFINGSIFTVLFSLLIISTFFLSGYIVAQKLLGKDDGVPKKDVVSPDRAIQLKKNWWAKNYGLPMINGEVVNGYIYVVEKEDFESPDRFPWTKLEFDINGCEYGGANGKFTFLVPLGMGEKAVTDNFGRVRRGHIDTIEIKKMFPLSYSKSEYERILEKYGDRVGEEFASEQLEKAIKNPDAFRPSERDDTNDYSEEQSSSGPQQYKKPQPRQNTSRWGRR